jgi:tetratricopeptide (TPR) repeat protein
MHERHSNAPDVEEASSVPSVPCSTRDEETAKARRRDEAALAEFEALAVRFRDGDPTVSLADFGDAAVGEVTTLRKLGRPQPAVAAATAALAALARAKDILPIELRIREERACALHESDDSEAALDECDRIIALGKNETNERVRQSLVFAMEEKAILLLNAGRYSESLAAIRARFAYVTGPKPTDKKTWIQEAWALATWAEALGCMGQWPEAIAKDEEVIERLAWLYGPRANLTAAKALTHQASAYRELGEPEEALDALDTLLDWFSDTDEPDLERLVDQAWVATGELLIATREWEKALALADDALSAWGHVSSPKTVEGLLQLLHVKVGALGMLDRHDEQVETLTDIMRRAEGADDAPAAATAFVMKAMALQELDRDEKAGPFIREHLARYGPAALKVFEDNIVHLKGASSTEALSAWGANMGLKAWTLRELGRYDDAEAVLDRSIAKLEDSEQPELQVLIEGARQMRLHLFGDG